MIRWTYMGVSTEPQRSALPATTAVEAMLSHRLVRRGALALGLALAAAFAFTIATADGTVTAGGGRLGGDYPAFYTGGQLIRSQARHEMYDFGVQSQAQRPYQPPGDETWSYFPYPPYVALAYAPLTAFGYKLSYALHTLLMVSAVVLALRLMRPLIPMVNQHYGVCVVAAIAFYPLYRAITGGQNTALSLLLIVWAWRSLVDGRDVTAGAALGLLLYKPQLALPIIGLQLIARRLRVVAVAAAFGATAWCVCTVLVGAGWASTWWRQISAFSKIDDEVNRDNLISLPSLSRAWLDSSLPGYLVAAVLAGAMVVIWNAGPGKDRTLLGLMAVLLPALVLMSPHALFYDAGLVVVSLAALAAQTRAAGVAAALWIGGIFDMAKSALGFTPLLFVVIAAFGATAFWLGKEPARDVAVCRS